jgi:glycosyltransferase involved in cell wall biosynthesis
MGELISDGVTGVLVANAAAGAAAMERIGELDRYKIRAVAIARFGCDRMVSEYEAVYRRVIASPGPPLHQWLRTPPPPQ